MPLPFRQVDVFGTGPYRGNPVAVVLEADGLDDESMAMISEWTNLSECTFVCGPTSSGSDASVRIFNLRAELPFAGHPVLGTARAWLDAGGVPRTDGEVVLDCGVGPVTVRVDGDELAFAAPPLIRSGPIEPELLTRVVDVLGADPATVLHGEWLDNGPGWIGLLLDSPEAVLALTPDASNDPGQWDIGVIAAYPPGSPVAFEVRAFFNESPSVLREDPVTGSLNAAAAQWLIGSGRATAPYAASQGTVMGRAGRVTISEEDGDIWVGGRTHVAIAGTIDPD